MCMYHHYHDYFHVQTLRTLNRYILANDVKIAKFINNVILTEYVVERKTTTIIDELSQK